MAQSTPEEFFRTEVHVGRVVKAEEFPAARKPAYRLTIDFGPLGEKRSSAQITARYTPEELTGRLVVAVTNFRPGRSPASCPKSWSSVSPTTTARSSSSAPTPT